MATGATTSATLKVETHRRVWSSTEAQRFIERCTAVRGEEANVIRIGHIAKPREQLLDAGPRQSQSAVLRVCHDVGQLATDARRICWRRCVSGHLTKGRGHKRTVGLFATNAATSEVASWWVNHSRVSASKSESRSPTSTCIASNITERSRASDAASELTARRIEISTRRILPCGCACQ